MYVFLKPTGSFESELGNRPAGDLRLAGVCRLQAAAACATVGSGLEGLSQTEADARLKKYGLNLVTREHKPTMLQELWGRARNPLNALLLTLAAVSYFLGDVRAAVVIATMVLLAITTAFIQEHRSNEAAAQLRAMVHTRASVRRGISSSDDPFSEIPMERLVPGDVVRLSAGDMIPGDLRLLRIAASKSNRRTGCKVASTAMLGSWIKRMKSSHLARRTRYSGRKRPGEPGQDDHCDEKNVQKGLLAAARLYNGPRSG